MIKKNHLSLLNLACTILLLGSTHTNCETPIDVQDQEVTVEHGPELSNDEILQMIAELKLELAGQYLLIKDFPEMVVEFRRTAAKIIILAKYLEEETKEEQA